MRAISQSPNVSKPEFLGTTPATSNVDWSRESQSENMLGQVPRYRTRWGRWSSTISSYRALRPERFPGEEGAPAMGGGLLGYKWKLRRYPTVHGTYGQGRWRDEVLPREESAELRLGVRESAALGVSSEVRVRCFWGGVFGRGIALTVSRGSKLVTEEPSINEGLGDVTAVGS